MSSDSQTQTFDDDPMEIDDTVADARIIVREDSGVHIIGGGAELLKTPMPHPLNKPEEIVILDDDDDEEPDPKRRKSEAPVIDLMEKSANSKCINYACQSGKEMMLAPLMCLSYYRVKNATGPKKEVCFDCYDKCVREYDLLAKELKAGRLLCKVKSPLRNEILEIDDSDEEEDVRVVPFDVDSMNFLMDNFNEILEKNLEKYKVREQANSEFKYIKDETHRLSGCIIDMQDNLKITRRGLDHIQFDLYNYFRAKTMETGVLTIIDDQYVTSAPIIRTESVLMSQENIGERNAPKRLNFVEVSTNGGSHKPVEQHPEEEPPKDLPLPGKLHSPEPRIDDVCYISRENSEGCWIKARLKAILPPGHLFNGVVSPFALYKLIELKQHKERIVDGKNVALMTPSKVRLERGTRVIAAFKEIGPTGEPKRAKQDFYYSGVVGEPPVQKNKYRYLIFFDIGYSQYVHYNNVHLVFEASRNVWEDMRASSQKFIKKFLEDDDRPMVKVCTGQTIKAEYNGQWVLCTVMNVDCSLVLVYFDSLNRMEWIFRGSSRLGPVFQEEQNAIKRHTGGRTAANRKADPSESVTIVQYTKKSDLEKPADETPRTVRAVARKSTARPENASPGFVSFLPTAEISSEPATRIMYFTPRDQFILKRRYKSHRCAPACKDFTRRKLEGHNPLSKPLLCGWARMTMRFRGRKAIVYKGPCGRILRNMEEVHAYLRMTRSELTVDLFDFNPMVRCLAEFGIDCAPNPKDLSNGLEMVPVPVINALNNEVLHFSNYATRRQPMEDVPLNTDPEFLIGCDCTDDCSDKTKCACWKLTLEGAKYVDKNVDPDTIGYNYRRLYEQVLTGIYECNSKCKCGPTCLNRVVQNPMSLKLQVFKTHNRGWGIRCLNDVPQGTFICIYAGTIHTEQMANEDGVTYGDEYFAELDYIENCEKHKEDYESEVIEPETPERRRCSKYADVEDFAPSNPCVINSETDRTRLRRRSQKGKEKLPPIETVTISDDENDPKEVLSFNPRTEDLEEKKSSHVSVRRFFGEEEPYIMDTKNAGNIGRFLNHSCSPNVFVQNVFVDTHDVRFPWVAFFCSQFIRAGTELTWNYNYDVGSVPGRVLYCHCGSVECKGRLL